MKLFSEIYSCYYNVLSKILESSFVDGLNEANIEKIIKDNAFYDTSFYILPKLFKSEWNILKKINEKYYPKIYNKNTKRPLSNLEKSWLVSILMDKKILLFISLEERKILLEKLSKIDPIFEENNFHIFDNALDGDPYNNINYINNFKKILIACKEKRFLSIQYGHNKKTNLRILPYKIDYSNRDDKFRLIGTNIKCNNSYAKTTLNFAKIVAIDFIDDTNIDINKLLKIYKKPRSNPPIVIEISRERNALERCMLQFSSWEKQTEYDDIKEKYICKIFYNKQDQTELLIRILSFGPVLRILQPIDFLNEAKKRIYKQYDLNHRIE